MSDDIREKGWWHTVPGMLTATAGVITAATGLIVALNQVGVFDPHSPSTEQEQIEAAQQQPAGDASDPATVERDDSAPAQRVSYSLDLPDDTAIRYGDLVYDVLAARLGAYGPGKRSLTFDIRLTNNGSYPVNFWAASFRLLISGVLRAPESDLNELVDGHSAKEGSVEFIIPDDVRRVGLQMGAVGAEAPVIPFGLRPAMR